MNDRYLFKAKRIDNGEWVQGYYIYYPYGMGSEVKEDHVIKDTIKGVAYFIDPATLCQCTGLKDKNKKLIWENDIIRHYNDQSKQEQYDAGIIFWDEEYARYKRSSEYDNKNYIVDRKCKYEVIGSIFDNPELLEVE